MQVHCIDHWWCSSPLSSGTGQDVVCSYKGHSEEGIPVRSGSGWHGSHDEGVCASQECMYTYTCIHVCVLVKVYMYIMYMCIELLGYKMCWGIRVYTYMYVYMYMYLYKSMYICTCMCMNMYMCMYMHMYMYVGIKQSPNEHVFHPVLGSTRLASVCIHILWYTAVILFTCTCIYMYMYMWVWQREHVHIHVHVHVYMYVYIKCTCTCVNV